MTHKNDIVFFCVFCSQKIAIPDSTGGFTVECPACLRRIPVPRKHDMTPPTPPADAAPENQQVPASPNGSGATKPPPQNLKRITIPKGASLNGAAPRPSSATVTIDPPPYKRFPPDGDISLFVLGCVCLILGVVSASVLPSAVFVHSALFLTSLVAALLCIARRMIATGTVLLFATILIVQLVEVPLVSSLLLRLIPEPAVIRSEEPPPAPEHESRQPFFEQAEAPAAPQAEEIPAATPQPPAAGETAEASVEPMQPAEVEAELFVKREEPAEIEPGIAEEPEILTPLADRKPEPVEPVEFTSKPSLPFSIYSDCSVELPYIPSGWMGYFDAIDIDDCWEENPHRGRSCFRIAYNATYYWGAVAWQSPANNWGDLAGGYDLTGAKELTFWARAERDATIAEFKVGIHSRGHFADTATVSTGKKKIGTQWKQYKLPLKDLDLSRVISGFVCVIEGAEIPPILYLDDIEYR